MGLRRSDDRRGISLVLPSFFCSGQVVLLWGTCSASWRAIIGEVLCQHPDNSSWGLTGSYALIARKGNICAVKACLDPWWRLKREKHCEVGHQKKKKEREEVGEARERWSRIAWVDRADQQADGKGAELFAAKQCSRRPPWGRETCLWEARTYCLPLGYGWTCQLVSVMLSVSSGGFNTRVMKSAEKKPFLKPSTSTRSPSIRGPKFKPLPSVEKGDILSEITVICWNHCHERIWFWNRWGFSNIWSIFCHHCQDARTAEQLLGPVSLVAVQRLITQFCCTIISLSLL